MPLILSPNLVNQALVMLNASVSDQFATWWSNNSTDGLLFKALSNPIFLSIAGILEGIPPNATIPPEPPIASINACAVFSP